MSKDKKIYLLKGFFLLALITILICPLVSQPQIILDKEIEATNYYETTFSLENASLVRLSVDSLEGCSLSLIDRMAGIIAEDGIPGDRDGQIVESLDAGTYKIKVNLAEDSLEGGRLSVFLFEEKNSPKEKETFLDSSNEMLSTSLMKDEKRSYWINIEEEEPLKMEFLGRSLSGIEIWKDGLVRTEIYLPQEVYPVVEGHPMNYIDVSSELEEGRYLLSVYGGEAQEWPLEEEGSPLYVRKGIPYLGSSLNISQNISYFGRDSFIVDSSSNYFELKSPEYLPANLVLTSFDIMANRHARTGNTGRISIGPDSPQNWDSTRYYPRGNDTLVTVKGSPGESYTLTAFQQADSYRFQRDEDSYNRYWISTISSEAASSSLDLTTYLMGEDSILQNSSVDMEEGTPFSRRINLSERQIIFLNNPKEGNYRIIENEEYLGRARYGVFSVHEMLEIRDLDTVEAGEDIFLPEGAIVLVVEPLNRGIVQFGLYYSGNIFTRSGQLRAARESFEQIIPPLPEMVWEDVSIPAYMKDDFTLYVNSRGNVPTGLDIRKLPLNLDDPLCFYLYEDEVSLPFFSDLPRIIQFDDRVEVVLDGRNYSPNQVVSEGEHLLLVKRKTEESFYTQLQTIPPPVSLENGGMPILEETYLPVSVGETLFTDYQRDKSQWFLLTVDSPSYYRIETTGRLRTSIKVRTPVLFPFFSKSQNGVGLNALVFAYLRPGQYLIEVASEGRTQGRAGFMVSEAPFQDAGNLAIDSISRRLVAPGESLVYTISTPEDLSLTLKNLGLNQQFSSRLEDVDGWPIEGMDSGFPGGDYRFFSLPSELESRRLSLLTSESEETEEGLIRLNERISGVWMESLPREPVVYTFSLSASLNTVFTAAEGFVYSLYQDGEEVASLTSRLEISNSLSLFLTEGDYQLKLEAIEEENHKPYNFIFQTDELIPGESLWVSALSETVIRISQAGFVDLYSYGLVDVGALLFDSSGNLIASNNDRPADWNFLISDYLEAGEYSLKLVPQTTSSRGWVAISMSVKEQRDLEAENFPFSLDLEAGQEVFSLPFSTASGVDGLYSFKTDGLESALIEIYKDGTRIASLLDQLVIPLEANTEYRLFVHPYGESESVRFQLNGTMVDIKEGRIRFEQNLSQSGQGLFFLAEDGLDIEIDSTEPSSLLVSSGVNRPCLPLENRPYNSSEGRYWALALDPLRLEANPVKLDAQGVKTFFLDENPHYFTVEGQSDQLSLLIAESQGLITGIRFSSEPLGSQDAYSWNGIQIAESLSAGAFVFDSQKSPRSALAGDSATTIYGELWRTSPIQRNPRTDIRTESYPLNLLEEIDLDQASYLQLEAEQAYRIVLPNEIEGVNLLMEAGTAAFSTQNGISTDLIYAAAENQSGSIERGEGLLYLLNTRDYPVLMRISSELSFGEPISINENKPFESLIYQDEDLYFRVEASSQNKRLFAAGSIDSLRFYGEDGRLRSGEEITTMNGSSLFEIGQEAGWLEVEAEKGFLQLFYAEEGMGLNYLVFGEKNPPDLDQAVPLAGANLVSGKGQVFEFSLTEASYLLLKTMINGAYTLIDEEGELLASSAQALLDDNKQVVSLEAGSYYLWVRPFEDTTQRWVVYSSFIYPIEIASDTENPPSFIEAEGRQAFRFRVVADSIIGVALEGENDSLSAELFDENGESMATGRYLYRELPEGSYVLMVKAGKEPLIYRPWLYGADGSLSDIPQEIIEGYKENLND